MTTKILLLGHDIATRLRLKEAWTALGVEVLAPTSDARPHCAVVDLGRRDALEQIARLRAIAADLPVVACAAAFDEALARLVHLLATADGTAPEAFRRLRPALTAHFGLSNVTKLSDALDQYDYDQALTCLNVRKPPSSPLSTDQP